MRITHASATVCFLSAGRAQGHGEGAAFSVRHWHFRGMPVHHENVCSPRWTGSQRDPAKPTRLTPGRTLVDMI
jgi:hypothetical protein